MTSSCPVCIATRHLHELRTSVDKHPAVQAGYAVRNRPK